jgi:hypothetical protein
MGRLVGRTHLPKWTGTVRVGFGICGPTQTDHFEPLQTPKWVGPVKMSLHLWVKDSGQGRMRRFNCGMHFHFDFTLNGNVSSYLPVSCPVFKVLSYCLYFNISGINIWLLMSCITQFSTVYCKFVI